MLFFDDISKYKSIAVVGLEKNTGKTESLNFIISSLQNYNKKLAVTSIGLDGENIDYVTRTPKPDIYIFENMLFVTSEKHYRERLLTSEILAVTNITTSLGRLIIARAITKGKIKISGPPDTANLKFILQELQNFNVDISIIDGAVSRLSLASPTVTDAMVLATGAALSANINELVKQTSFVYELISLPQINKAIKPLLKCDDNIKIIDSIHSDNPKICNVNKPSALNVDKELLSANIIYLPGMLNNKIISSFSNQKKTNGLTIIVQDFTKIFLTRETLTSFINKGNNLMVVDKPNLIAITVNPTSPSGYHINSDLLLAELKKHINVPIINVKP